MSENKIGRPEKYSSNSEREKIQSEKNKEYQKEYLKVRRKRYEEDASYRESIILREREAYIKNNPNFQKNEPELAQFNTFDDSMKISNNQK